MIISFYTGRILFFFSSPHWFFMWVSIEILTLCFIPFIKHNKKTPKEIEAITTYFIVQGISSVTLIFRVLSLEIENMSNNRSLKILGLAALIFKIAAAPLHRWFPQIGIALRQTPFVLLLTLQKLQPFLFIAATIALLKSFVVLFILFSSVLGNLTNFKQRSILNILCFSSISHTGWMLTAIIVSQDAWTFYFLVYCFLIFWSGYLLWGNTQQLMIQTQKAKLNWAFVVISLAGIPPLLGFFPKLLVLDYVISKNLLIVLFVLLVVSVADFFIYTRLSYFFTWKKTLKMLWQKKISSVPSSALMGVTAGASSVLLVL